MNRRYIVSLAGAALAAAGLAGGCESQRSTVEVRQSRHEGEPQMESPGEMETEYEMESPGQMIVE